MNSDIRLPYIELLPGTPEHKEFIASAIKKRDQYQLAALKDRIHLPVHIVSSWFAYSCIRQGNKMDVVAIFTSEDKEAIKRLQQVSNNSQQANINALWKELKRLQ